MPSSGLAGGFASLDGYLRVRQNRVGSVCTGVISTRIVLGRKAKSGRNHIPPQSLSTSQILLSPAPNLVRVGCACTGVISTRILLNPGPRLVKITSFHHQRQRCKSYWAQLQIWNELAARAQVLSARESYWTHGQVWSKSHPCTITVNVTNPTEPSSKSGTSWLRVQRCYQHENPTGPRAKTGQNHIIQSSASTLQILLGPAPNLEQVGCACTGVISPRILLDPRPSLVKIPSYLKWALCE
jgi:hypothetical protein